MEGQVAREHGALDSLTQRVAGTRSGLVATGAAGQTWTSPDGAAWTASSVPDGGAGTWPARDIAVARGGMVSASQGWMASSSGNPIFDLGPVWRSADGSSWTASEWPTPGAPLVFAGDGSRIAATGSDGSGIWWSDNGSTWTKGAASGAIPAPGALTKARPGVWLTRSWLVVGGTSCLYVGAITG